ncbi:hypothetical protein [Salinibacillus xinjiangensis]|uniref:Uncharacterized protein n=1 Tax=Salinibacillus xinjiangensis TaxID=1229268 RepID=A0A6G1X3U8_9BACI|nr:hypothetical protein [Salinibacillus xinjiangensis]MRG85634.1 hypothetical protein [Salinibacillus xinjiangensis]
MMFESSYRRQALKKWEEDKPELKKELNERIQHEKKQTKDPIMYVLTSIVAWFTQH